MAKPVRADWDGRGMGRGRGDRVSMLHTDLHVSAALAPNQRCGMLPVSLMSCTADLRTSLCCRFAHAFFATRVSRLVVPKLRPLVPRGLCCVRSCRASRVAVARFINRVARAAPLVPRGSYIVPF